jgi:hypothetical protein
MFHDSDGAATPGTRVEWIPCWSQCWATNTAAKPNTATSADTTMWPGFIGCLRYATASTVAGSSREPAAYECRCATPGCGSVSPPKFNPSQQSFCLAPAPQPLAHWLSGIANRLSTGRLRVHDHLEEWFAGYRRYRRDEKGEIDETDDHLIGWE